LSSYKKHWTEVQYLFIMTFVKSQELTPSSIPFIEKSTFSKKFDKFNDIVLHICGRKWEEMVFIGEYWGRIDDKGRVVIPSKLRKTLFTQGVKNVYITRGLEACLFVFSETIWNVQTEKLKSLSFTKVDPRAFTRLFFSGAFQSKIDRQGRIVLPQNLSAYAGLKENIVIIGAGDRLEIWSEDNWNTYSKKALESYGKIAETLLGT